MFCRDATNKEQTRRHSHAGDLPMAMHESHDMPNTFTPTSSFDMHLNIADAFTAQAGTLEKVPIGELNNEHATKNHLDVPVPTFTPRDRDASVCCGNGVFHSHSPMHHNMHGFNASALHQRRASCGPELLKGFLPHASCPMGDVAAMGGSSAPLSMGARRASEPLGAFDPVAIIGQKRDSDAFNVYHDLANSAALFMNTSFEHTDGFPGEPSPVKSPRLSYDAGAEFARRMHGQMYEDSENMAVSCSSPAYSSPRALLVPTAPDLFQDPCQSLPGSPACSPSAKLNGPDPSMDGLWQMLASEPTLMTNQVHLEPRPISEMERSEMGCGGMSSHSFQPAVISCSAPVTPRSPLSADSGVPPLAFYHFFSWFYYRVSVTF